MNMNLLGLTPFFVLLGVTGIGFLFWANEREWVKALVCLAVGFCAGLAIYFKLIGA